MKVAGRWRYVYRAIDQSGQVIDVFVPSRRDATAARRFFQQAIATTAMIPVEVVTDRAAAYPPVLDELLPMAWHRAEQYANNRPITDEGVAVGGAFGSDTATDMTPMAHRVAGVLAFQ